MLVGARVKSEPGGSLLAHLHALEGSSPVTSAHRTLWRRSPTSTNKCKPFAIANVKHTAACIGRCMPFVNR